MPFSGRMTRWATVIAPINSFIRPPPFRIGDGRMTGGVKTKINLVYHVREERATVGDVMNLMVTVGLLVFVDDKILHSFTMVECTTNG